jgi:hypothetical protein
MDGSGFGPERAGFRAAERRTEMGTLPDREWGLSAWQVVLVVLAIVAGSELIGVFFS